MSDMDEYVIFDRAIEIRSKDGIESFLDDPAAYLEKIGALEGLPEFNGFIDRDGKKIENMRAHLSTDGRSPEIVRAFHYGIPYDYPYYCSYLA